MNTKWDATKTVWSSVLGPILKGTLRYNDFRRRRSFRRHARALITCDPWPGNDATPIQLAQLALSRTLHLQKETRRTVRHPEAIALLARTTLETCVVGLYCLYADDPLTLMRGGNARALRRLLSNLGSDDILTEEVLESIAKDIGGEGRLPDVKRMAETIAKALGDIPAPLNLYWRIYVPLSEFFAHANGVSLLRHVDSNGAILDKPSFPWARWSAVHLVDGCVGFLAAAIAHKDGRPMDSFANYADYHLQRALAPLVVTSGKGLFRSLGLAKFAALVNGFVNLVAYKTSGRADSDSHEERVVFLRSWFDRYWKNLGDISEELSDLYVERVITVLADASSAPTRRSS